MICGQVIQKSASHLRIVSSSPTCGPNHVCSYYNKSVKFHQVHSLNDLNKLNVFSINIRISKWLRCLPPVLGIIGLSHIKVMTLTFHNTSAAWFMEADFRVILICCMHSSKITSWRLILYMKLYQRNIS